MSMEASTRVLDNMWIIGYENMVLNLQPFERTMSAMSHVVFALGISPPSLVTQCLNTWKKDW